MSPAVPLETSTSAGRRRRPREPRHRRWWTLVGLLVLAAGLAACDVGPLYGSSSGVFPSNELTVADPAQVTGRRVNLRLPTCEEFPSDCNEIELINQLDGFDVDPRITVNFDEPIDPADVDGASLWVERVDDGSRIGLNRLIYRSGLRQLHARTVAPLEPATDYEVVSTAALDGRARRVRFTTMSTSHELEAMRDQLDSGTAYTAAGIAPSDRELDFVDPSGTRTVFDAANVALITRYNDIGSGQTSSEVAFDSDLTGVGTYAFGSFLAPSWLDEDRVIPRTPSAGGEPQVTGAERIGFALIVPAGTPPPGGWPVAVFGPGVTRSKYDVFLAADLNATEGLATIAIDPVGHAYGPGSEVGVTRLLPPGEVRFSAFGRGSDVDGDGSIGPREGLSAPAQPHPLAAIGLRDGLRQTAADNMSLIRAIAAGSDVDGDGTDDLSAGDLRYYAQSLGGIYGTIFAGVEDRIEAAAFTVPGSTITEIARLAPGFRPEIATELANRVPSRLNGGDEGFTEALPLYLDPPVIDPALDTRAIQEIFARTDWINRPGSPDAYAPLLRDRPLAGQTAKRVLYQFAFGDETVPNPTSANLMRAGNFSDVTTLYRNDLTPTATEDPHGLLLDPRISGRQLAQLQFAEFLGSNGTSIIDPDGASPVFETPIADPDTLETLNFEP